MQFARRYLCGPQELALRRSIRKAGLQRIYAVSALHTRAVMRCDDLLGVCTYNQ